VLEELYTQETEQIIADNMNKCYVAMTRPIERLYVGNHHEKGEFGKLFHQVLQMHPEAREVDGAWIVDLDQGARHARPATQSPVENFHPVDIHDYLWFPHIALQDKAELYDQDYLSEEMQYGLEFHQLAASIHRADEITEGIERGISDGSISALHRKKLQEDLQEIFRNETYLALLNDAQSILSEQSIIGAKGVIHRPDKIILKAAETIILDFKTGLPQDTHTKQIKNYKKSLEEMGYPAVGCYLYYSSIHEFRQVV
jgi:ATP-dependent exoDNAse (exonuclease V) beta subunit